MLQITMKRSAFFILAFVTAVSTLFAVPVAYAIDGAALLTSCANSINDPLYTRSGIATILGFASATDLETAITNATITVFIANGPGEIPGSAGSNGNARDLYCGDSNDNSVPYMDSSANTSFSIAGGVTQVPFRTATTITVVFSVAAKATFYAAGKRIGNCISTATGTGDSLRYSLPSKIQVLTRTTKR